MATYTENLDNFLNVDTISNNQISSINVDSKVADGSLTTQKISNLKVDTIEVSPTGYIRSGKTSFTDTTLGWYQSAEGIYFGSADDATKFKFRVDNGSIDFIGAHSWGSVGWIPMATIVSGNTSTADIVPTGLTCSSTTANVASDGSVSSSVVLTWDAIATTTFDHYVIRYKKASYTYYTYLNANTNTITIEGLTPSVSYNFGVASVNKYGSVSAYSADITQTTATSTTAPATVSSTSATAWIQYIIIEWTKNTEADLASYNIYRNTTNNSATATLIGNCLTNYFVDGGRTWWTEYFYWIKAVNTSWLLSASFSTVRSATPRNVTSDDIVTLAGSKVLIDGSVYLSDWRTTWDLTKINGGQISTNSITLAQLNFIPIQGTNVIASINASAEGIKIDADNLRIGTSTNYWDISTSTKTALTATSTDDDVVINYGKTDFGDNTTAGFILGYDYSDTTSKFEMGSSATKLFKYDGTDISLIGGSITGGTITIGTGDNVFFAGSNGIQLWDATFADAPFSVSMAGALKATSATLGWWTVNSTSIYTGTEDHSWYTANAWDITIYSNGADASIHGKNFYIDTSGNLTATSVSVTGALTTGIGSSISGTYIDSLDAGKINVGTLTGFTIQTNNVTYPYAKINSSWVTISGDTSFNVLTSAGVNCGYIKWYDSTWLSTIAIVNDDWLAVIDWQEGVLIGSGSATGTVYISSINWMTIDAGSWKSILMRWALIPTSADDLGSSDYYWGKLYCGTTDVVWSMNVSWVFTTDTWFRTWWASRPTAAHTINLWSESYPWLNIYSDSIQITKSWYTTKYITMNTSNNLEINTGLYVGWTLSKSAGSFRIDHPLKPDTHYLQHSFVESPDMLNLYTWNGVIKNGLCEIQMPDWFIALNGEKDFTYQLTPYWQNSLCIAEEMNNDGKVVFAGTKDWKFSYLITAIRHDKYAEENRIQVELKK